MMMRQILFLLLTTSTIVLAQPKPVTVGVLPGSGAGSSVGSYFSQKSPASITAFVSGTLFTSLDSGATWTEARVPGSQHGQGLYLANDSKGNLYYFYAAPADNGTEGFFSRSTDGGKKWSEAQSLGVAPGLASNFTLGNHPKKDALTVAWTQTGQAEGAECTSNIFAINTSGGKKWSEPRRLSKDPGPCDDNGLRLVPSTPLIARDGKTFVLWAGNEKIHLDRSYDGGGMWINSDIKVADQAGGWQPIIPGSASGGPAFSVTIDNTMFRTIGTLYLVYADQKHGATDTDIWIIRSPNFGDNWTYPLQVNKDEPGTHQYSPKIAVDQETGFVYAVYFDRRNGNDNATDVYLAYSGDAGGTFEEKKITDVPFQPDGTIPELLSVAAHKGVINIIWTTTDGGKTSVRSVTLRQDRLD